MKIKKGMIFSHIAWKESLPFFVFLSGDERIFFPIKEENFSFTFDTLKYFCTGYLWEGMIPQVCKGKNTVKNPGERCAFCEKNSVFHPAFYNLTEEHISSDQKKYNLQKHYVYIAFFGDDIFKVGITNTKRGYVRLLEQGAKKACILQECIDAHEAREMERKIHIICKLPEVISHVKKRKLLLVHEEEKKDALFFPVLEKIQKIYPEIQQPKYIDFSEYQEFSSYTTPEKDLTPEIDGCFGKCVGFFGQIGVFAWNSHAYSLSFKKFSGCKIIDEKIDITPFFVQNSLF